MKLDMGEALHNITMEVRFPPGYWLRLWIAVRLVYLAALIAGMRAEVSIDDGANT